MPIIKFVDEKKEIQVAEGANLRKAAMKAGIRVYPHIHNLPLAHCPGWGMCGTCRMLIVKGMDNCSPKAGIEKLRLGMSMAYIGNEDTMRLSCQVSVNGDIEVKTRPGLNKFGENFFS